MAKRTKATTIPVGTRALMQRINRRLAEHHQKLKACRGTQWRGDLGDYYVVDEDRNVLVETHVDLDRLGRRLGALGAAERIAD